VVALRADALGRFEDGWTKVGSGADKDNGPVARRDGPHEGSCATQMGKCALEVYDSDIRAGSVCIWDEIWIKQGAVVAEVCPSGEKSGESQVAWGCGTV
jgi:hypothetical protein